MTWGDGVVRVSYGVDFGGSTPLLCRAVGRLTSQRSASSAPHPRTLGLFAVLEHGAVHDRSVHLLRRAEVAASVRAGDASSARLRGAGSPPPNPTSPLLRCTHDPVDRAPNEQCCLLFAIASFIGHHSSLIRYHSSLSFAITPL